MLRAQAKKPCAQGSTSRGARCFALRAKCRNSARKAFCLACKTQWLARKAQRAARKPLGFAREVPGLCAPSKRPCASSKQPCGPSQMPGVPLRRAGEPRKTGRWPLDSPRAPQSACRCRAAGACASAWLGGAPRVGNGVPPGLIGRSAEKSGVSPAASRASGVGGGAPHATARASRAPIEVRKALRAGFRAHWGTARPKRAAHRALEPGVPLSTGGSTGSHQNGFITMSARPGWLGRSSGPGIGSFERQGKLSRSRRRKLSSITEGIGTPSTSTTPA